MLQPGDLASPAIHHCLEIKLSRDPALQSSLCSANKHNVSENNHPRSVQRGYPWMNFSESAVSYCQAQTFKLQCIKDSVHLNMQHWNVRLPNPVALGATLQSEFKGNTFSYFISPAFYSPSVS